MLKKYKTIFKTSKFEIVEKKSRFIATIKPIQNEEQAISFINEIKKENYNARHNVFAYRFQDSIERYSDDGEPSGTAGLPILGVLRGEEITDVAVVVTRYFGGTLLGTGGLVRAYQLAVKEALQNSVVIEKILCSKISLTTDYNLSGKIQYEISNKNHIIYETIYTDVVEFILLVEDCFVEIFFEQIKNLTSNSVLPIIISTLYVSFVEKKLHVFEI